MSDFSKGCQTPSDWTPTDGQYPVMGDEQLMSPKAHGTSNTPVQTELRYGCDTKLADQICNFNRHCGHSPFHAHQLAQWGQRAYRLLRPNSGKPLFQAPINRTFSDFLKIYESRLAQFRDDGVNWVCEVLPDGECVSIDGTHLGHNVGL